MKQEVNMLSGNLFKKIIFFSIPIILSSFLQLLYNAVDLAVVGKFCGNESLAAVGSTGALINLIVNVFIGVSVGANVSVARAVAQRDEDKTHKLVHTAILFSILAGIFLMFFGIFTSRMWLELMGTTEDSLDLATLYLQIYFGGMVFNMVYNFGAAILRSVGETKKPLYFLGIAGLVNVGLNLLLVVVFHLDVAGVAIGTIVSQAISAVLIVLSLMKRQGIIHLNLKKLKIHAKSLGEMIIIGLPAGIQGSLFSISNVFIQSAVNSFKSSVVVAGNTAAANIEGFVYAGMNSFYQACITFTSQNYGAGKVDNCKKVLRHCIILVTIIGIFLGCIALLFGESLLSLYTNDKVAIEYGMIRLGIICFIYFTCGIMDVLVGGLRGLGYSIVPMVVSILGACVFRLVWIYTVFQSFHKLEVLYISYPISWIVTGGVHLICYIFVYKRVKQKIAMRNVLYKNQEV